VLRHVGRLPGGVPVQDVALRCGEPERPVLIPGSTLTPIPAAPKPSRPPLWWWSWPVMRPGLTRSPARCKPRRRSTP